MSDGGKKKHGGKRKGAGRKRKWDYGFKFEIGQACEALHRAEIQQAVEKQKEDLTNQQTELQYFWQKINSIPVHKRSLFRKSELFDDHQANIAAELDLLAVGDAEEVPRVFHLEAKAPRGTRKRIIKQIAEQFGLSTKQVDNLWQAYRRFERE